MTLDGLFCRKPRRAAVLSLKRLSERQTAHPPPPDKECDAKCCKCQGTCEDVTSSSVQQQSGFESRAEYGSQRPGTPLMNNADPLQSAQRAQTSLIVYQMRNSAPSV